MLELMHAYALAYLVFLSATWEEYHTHCLFLGYFNGPVEGSITVSLAAIATAAFGQGIWTHKVTDMLPSLGVGQQWTLQDAAIGLIITVSIGSLAGSVKNAVRARGVKVIPSLLSAILPQYLSLVWFARTPTLHNPLGYVLFVLFAGFIATNQIFRIILATVSRDNYPHFITPYYALAILYAHRWLTSYLPPTLYHVDSTLIIGANLAFLVLCNAHCGMSVIRQVCLYLDIPCLTLPSKTKAKAKGQ